MSGHDISSSYYSDQIFEELSSDILNFGGEGTPILYTRDFNARIGNLSDKLDVLGHDNLSIPIGDKFPEIPKRHNCDCVVNSHGEKVIQFCKNYDLKIMNGRTKGDVIGNFTHLNVNGGNSTIDYSVCNHNAYTFLENFIVLPMNEISDHSKIITYLKTDSPKKEVQDNYKWNKLIRFKWDKNISKMFSKRFTFKQCEIDEISQRLEAGLIESTGEKIQSLFFQVAKDTLQEKGNYTNRNRNKKKIQKNGLIENAKNLKRG